jgi:hypothetical protein
VAPPRHADPSASALKSRRFRANSTPERLARNAESQRRYLAKRTPEQRESQREYDRARYAGRREQLKAAATARYRALTPEQRAHVKVQSTGNYRRRMYGLAPAQFDALVAQQGGMCKLCRSKSATYVDHDHITGEVRGVLCPGCNAGLGLLGDTSEGLQAGIDYLLATREVVPMTDSLVA